MAISSNSVIHFTSKFENLTGIINHTGFRLKYCSEKLLLNDIEFDIATPMVCFCDIALSEIKNHVDSYGNYGIGLNKIWAKKQSLNPVLYIDNASETAKLFEKVFNRFLNINDQNPNNVDDDLLSAFFALTQYCKNYEGHLKQGKINSDNYRFYNEREWRFIPNESLLGKVESFLLNKDYTENKETHNEKLKNLYLNFDVDDISYIILNDEDEIPEMLKLIQNVYEDRCTAKQLKVLGTKFITTNQIFNDF